MSLTSNLDQRRARHAWKAVQKAKPGPAAPKFRDESKRLPVRIMTSGLGASIAFLNAKKSDGGVVDALADWLLREMKSPATREDLVGAIVEGSSDDLRHHTGEALAYLQWLTRFAEAEIDK